jgi:hypothetical protein
MTTRASIADELNASIDCEDLAYKLSLERPGDRGNFKHPQTDSKHSPTLSVLRGDDGRSRFFCHRTGDKGGPIDLYLLARSCDVPTAIRELAQMYGKRLENPNANTPPAERTRAEWIAAKAQENAKDPELRVRLFDYLQGRGITDQAITAALAKGTLGINNYTSPKLAEGEPGWGGEGVSFIVRDPGTLQAMAVETRYFDAAKNGKVKSNCQGDKSEFFWCIDWRRFAAAKKVYVVESGINALSIDSCNLPGVVAVATLGTNAVVGKDWRMFIGKSVVLAFDNDPPLAQGGEAGYCPGLKAAWHVHEQLVALDVPAVLLCTDDWQEDDEPLSDLNDLLQARGVPGLTKALKTTEPWLIAGMHGETAPGKPRLWLPSHDFAVYWRFRTQDDFTAYVDKFKTNDESNRKESFELSNVCGFRVASISRVRIASVNSMMSGDKDLAPHTLFALSVQVPREGTKLLRRVVQDEGVHNIELWKKLGPVFSPSLFSRMVNILERAADLGARDAINFVGIAWKNGRPVVNEARDCYFTDPPQQCPYHNLVFPSGQRTAAATVIAAYQKTFGRNAGSQVLVWALGAHLKAFFGYWPHFALQAEKGTGKDVFTKRLERTIGMQIFSRQTMQTEFRILGSVSFTSHPVGWGEISANKVDILAKALHTLQESYQFTYSTRGTEKKEFLLCAPVLLVGEEVDAKTLQGKLVVNHMAKATRGPLMPDDLPVFPVRAWLDYLAATPKERVMQLHAASVAELTSSCMAARDDAGADRMLQNYAGVRTAWMLLCDFADIPVNQGDFLGDLTRQMNTHIRDSVSERQPWVWIMDTLLSEISRGNFRHPFVFDVEDEEEVLCVRTSHVMDHMARENSLKEFFNHLPIKSDRIFKAQLKAANVVAIDDAERTCQGKRVAHMVGLSLKALQQYGLHAVKPAVPAQDAN